MIREKLNRVITYRTPVKMVTNKAGRPLASFTFDDFPRSAWLNGGPVLARHDVKATYYAVGSFCGQTVEGQAQYVPQDLVAAAAAGHEIGSHTFSHGDVYQFTDQVLLADELANQSFVSSHLGDYRLSSFAYPYGEASPRTKRLFANAYSSSRGILPGINGRVMDLAQLKSVGIERKNWSAAMIERKVAKAKAGNGWIIFFTHDISEDPSPFGATPAMLEHAIETVKAAGIEILPVKHALAVTQF